MEKALLWCGGGVVIWKVGDLHQVKGKLNQTGHHSILQHHGILSETQLVIYGFVLIKDNEQKRTITSTRGTLTAKRNTSFNWCLGQHNQWNLVPLNLTKKSELNNPQVQLTSAKKPGQNYVLSTTSLWWK